MKFAGYLLMILLFLFLGKCIYNSQSTFPAMTGAANWVSFSSLILSFFTLLLGFCWAVYFAKKTRVDNAKYQLMIGYQKECHDSLKAVRDYINQGIVEYSLVNYKFKKFIMAFDDLYENSTTCDFNITKKERDYIYRLKIKLNTFCLENKNIDGTILSDLHVEVNPLDNRITYTKNRIEEIEGFISQLNREVLKAILTG